jgi:hypothetical protein
VCLLAQVAALSSVQDELRDGGEGTGHVGIVGKCAGSAFERRCACQELPPGRLVLAKADGVRSSRRVAGSSDQEKHDGGVVLRPAEPLLSLRRRRDT